MTPDGPTDDEDSEDTVARTQIRAAWHTFCDRLDVRKRETKTPGQVARTAIAAGFPVATIRRLVRIFRTVEYGGVSPTDEQVAEATAAADELDDFTPEEDSS